MIYITGDTHADFRRFNTRNFPEQRGITKDDYVIVCGDFGIWDGSRRENHDMDWLDGKPFTTLFVDGNHENFDLLNRYPVTQWHGGRVHIIRPNVIHLMRGQIYGIDGKRIFTFGGGLSIDKSCRTPYISWWPEEEPSTAEMALALDNLAKVGNRVDYIITHACPQSIMRNVLCNIQPMLQMDCVCEKFLDRILDTVSYEMWYCGHYHMDVYIGQYNLQVLYQSIIACTPGYPTVGV